MNTPPATSSSSVITRMEYQKEKNLLQFSSAAKLEFEKLNPDFVLGKLVKHATRKKK